MQNLRWSTGGMRGSIRPNAPTQFEVEVARLGLKSEAEMLQSKSLYRWASKHSKKLYIPTWLLAGYGIHVWETDVSICGEES